MPPPPGPRRMDVDLQAAQRRTVSAANLPLPPPKRCRVVVAEVRAGDAAEGARGGADLPARGRGVAGHPGHGPLLGGLNDRGQGGQAVALRQHLAQTGLHTTLGGMGIDQQGQDLALPSHNGRVGHGWRGRREGYEAGYDTGSSEGHEQGNSEGNIEGYDRGYTIGFKDGKR